MNQMKPRGPGPASTVPYSQAISRAMPTQEIPSPDQRRALYATQIYTYFTKAGEERVLYTADQEWVKIVLLLETAGPVAVSTKATFTPVLSGKGALLPTGTPKEFYLARGNRLYIAATAVNRIEVTLEPLPWQQQLLGGVVQGFDAVVKTLLAAIQRTP